MGRIEATAFIHMFKCGSHCAMDDGTGQGLVEYVLVSQVCVRKGAIRRYIIILMSLYIHTGHA